MAPARLGPQALHWRSECADNTSSSVPHPRGIPGYLDLMSEAPVQGKYDTKIEAEFSNGLVPQLTELGFDVVYLRHDDVRHVLFVNLAVADAVTREQRRHVMSLLREFEDRYGNTVSVEPAYVPAGASTSGE
jgi:hypothetical protein